MKLHEKGLSTEHADVEGWCSIQKTLGEVRFETKTNPTFLRVHGAKLDELDGLLETVRNEAMVKILDAALAELDKCVVQSRFFVLTFPCNSRWVVAIQTDLFSELSL